MRTLCEISHKQPLKANDHDFPDAEKGKATPYGIYDIRRNEDIVNVGLSADTGAFAANSIRSQWTRLWKTSLQEFANETG